jgi:hypothetical protein
MADDYGNIIRKAKSKKYILDQKMKQSIKFQASEIEAELLKRMRQNMPRAVSSLLILETDDGWEMKLLRDD